ncbi:MAG: FKBP-type peptidyl-prolyl cis-trans isomerase [Mediterranea sp.]|jgi:FKBP-type peptidyl-prolyl cis-trans isomerase FklB|nr:FKBP-type peptidyl-prolyl cis-trans isomerase [Mediterranea sp.]
MKKITLFMAIAVAAGLASCTAQAPKANLKTEVDTLSYAIGMARTEGLTQYLGQAGIEASQMGDFMKGLIEGSKMVDPKDNAYMQGLQIGQTVATLWVENLTRDIFGSDSTQSISRDNMLAGFIAGVKVDSTIMKKDAATAYMQTNIERIREKALEIQYADNKAAGEKFLAENKTKEGVITTPSGLQYKILKEGKGAIPADTSIVNVNYRGTLIDGKEFDSSYKNNKPISFRANLVIKGWTEALQMMPVGSKWELYIPQDLAYGKQQSGPDIKPFSALIFEVELVGIEK